MPNAHDDNNNFVIYEVNRVKRYLLAFKFNSAPGASFIS